MRYIKWVFWIVVTGLVVGAFHYTLPQRDIVRVVETEVRRVDFGSNGIFWASPDPGTAAAGSRDVRFISAVRPNGKVIVYRNEDTGWGWPPYFKLDSSDLQAEAANVISTSDAPKWMILRHYGWRNNWISIFPNALSMKPALAHDQTLIPWFNIALILILIAILRTIQVRVRRWWRRIRGIEDTA